MLVGWKILPHRDGRMQIRQAVITGKEQVELQELELVTDDLLSEELLIETEVSFISAGTELANYTAADPDVYQPGAWCAYPWKSGYGSVGTVLAAGEKHHKLIGRRVFTNGPHASVTRYRTDATNKLVAPVPTGLSSVEAAAARMAVVAMSGLEAATWRPGGWVVIFGLGMVGNLAAQLFHLSGAHVIGVDPSATRRRIAQECGIAHAITGTETEIAEQVKAITGGAMAQVTLDAVGHSSVCLQALRLTATGGELVVLGSPRTEVQGNLTEIFRTSHMRWITIKGALEWRIPTEAPLGHEYDLQKRVAAVFAWLADGRLKLKPMLTHTLPPEQIRAAYEGLLRDKESYVGVVLKWK